MDCVSHCHDVVLREFNSSETMTWNLTSWRSMFNGRTTLLLYVCVRSPFDIQFSLSRWWLWSLWPWNDIGFLVWPLPHFPSCSHLSSRRRRRMLSLFVSDYVPKKGNFSQWVNIETRNDVKGSIIKENWISRWDISNFPSLILLASCPVKNIYIFSFSCAATIDAGVQRRTMLMLG